MFVVRKLLRHRVFKNFSYLTLGSLLSQFVGVFTVIRITHLFAPENYGMYTFLVSQGTLLFTIGDLGITNVVIRTIARDRQKTNEVVFNGAIIRCAAVAMLVGIYTCYNYFFGSLTNTQLLFIYLYALVTCFGHLFEIAFMGNERMLPVSLVNVSYSVCWFLTVILLPQAWFTVAWVFTAYLLLNAAKAIALYVVLKAKKLLRGKIRLLSLEIKPLIRQSWPYFLLMLLMLPATYLPNNFLQLRSNNAEIGYFNLSQKLTAPVDLVVGFLLSAIFPNLSVLWHEDKNRFNFIVAKGFQFIMLAGLVLCFLFTLFGRELVVFIFKPAYLPAAAVFQLHIWYSFLMGVNSLTGTILSAVNKEKLVLQSGIVSAVIATPLLFYGSKYGAIGLSYAYVISFGASMIYVWHLFTTQIKENINNSRLLWVLVLVLFLLSYFIIQHLSIMYKLIIAVSVAGGVAVYFFKTGKTLVRR